MCKKKCKNVVLPQVKKPEARFGFNFENRSIPARLLPPQLHRYFISQKVLRPAYIAIASSKNGSVLTCWSFCFRQLLIAVRLSVRHTGNLYLLLMVILGGFNKFCLFRGLSTYFNHSLHRKFFISSVSQASMVEVQVDKKNPPAGLLTTRVC